jgi:lysophospholipase L1-like esterase
VCQIACTCKRPLKPIVHYLSCSKQAMARLPAVIVCCFIALSSAAQPIDSTTRTILFLGNSITYAGMYITDIEACYRVAHPVQSISFLNLGLPSETVSQLSEEGHAGGRFPRPALQERLYRIVGKIKPSIVFVSYGMNDGIYLPFNQARFEKYKAGMVWLHDTLVAIGARVIVLTPPVYDEQRGAATGYAAVLDGYSNWLLQQPGQRHWEVIDIHYPMKKYLAAHRRLDKQFGLDGFALASDGIHPGETGHWLMAQELLRHLGEKSIARHATVQEAMAGNINGLKIFALVAERQLVMKDAWLTATGHKRPEMNTGLPLEEALEKAAAIERSILALQP